jgi:exodeoxyribonuclease VII large subunit
LTKQTSFFDVDFDAPRLTEKPAAASPVAQPAAPPPPKASAPSPIGPAAAPATPPAPAAPALAPRKVFSVAEICRAAQLSLEARFADVWVEGEVSNYKPHPSGHLYFSLKDQSAQMPCVIWRSAALRVRFKIADGMKVLCRGKLSLYEQQGRVQLYVEAVEPVGLGALHLAYEQLKKKLSAEGLFDPKLKRPLPRAPRVIGVVTSKSGAAVRDIIRVLHRRWPARIVVAPAAVQGPTAPLEIVRAIQSIQRLPDLEVLIVGRGGGSIEDLWAFNDEAVARAIRACRVPVVSAVGHEVDFTIADLVADVRAATPSAAAELVVPFRDDLLAELATLRARLGRAMVRGLAERRVRIDRACERMEARVRRTVADRRPALDELSARLRRDHPRARLLERRGQLQKCEGRLEAAMRRAIADRRRRFEGGLGRLDALSPLRVLDRGYALARTPQGHVVKGDGDVVAGDPIQVRVSHAELSCEIKSVKKLEET